MKHYELKNWQRARAARLKRKKFIGDLLVMFSMFLAIIYIISVVEGV